MNSCSFVGYVANKDIELKECYINGKPIDMVEFTLAVRTRKDDNHFNYLKCLAYNGTARTLVNYGHKGVRLGVTCYARTFIRETQNVKYTETLFIIETYEVLSQNTNNDNQKVEQPVDVECDLDENEMPLDMMDKKVE